MIAFKKIIAGVDLNPDSRQAIREAGHLAARDGTSLHVLRVAPADLLDAYQEIYKYHHD